MNTPKPNKQDSAAPGSVQPAGSAIKREEVPYEPPQMAEYRRECAERNTRLLGRLQGEPQADGLPTSDVRLIREDKVWHVWIDGEHVCECCDFTFNAAVDRLKARLSPNAEVSEGGTRDSRIETAAQSRPSLR